MRHWHSWARRAAAGVVAAVAMLAAGCTGASPHAAVTGAARTAPTSAPSVRTTPGRSASAWWRPGINCGLPAMARIAGHVIGVGDCAGLFVVPAAQVRLRVGEQFQVHMMELTPVFTLPASSSPAVLRRVAVSLDGVTGTYQAMRAGRAVLISDAWCVGARISQEIKGSCPVLDVTVLPG
jgi:hypothetical protein